MLSRTLVPLVIVAALASPAPASPGALDQVSPASNAWFHTYPGNVWQQQVRAGVGGVLDAFEVTVVGPLGSQVELRLRSGDGWSVGPVLWSALYTKTTAGLERPVFDACSAGLVLAAGDTFVLEAEGNGSGLDLVGSYLHPSLGPANYAEELFLDGPGCYLDCGWRIGFRTWMARAPAGVGTCPAPVAVPSLVLPLPGGAPGAIVVPSPLRAHPPARRRHAPRAAPRSAR